MRIAIMLEQESAPPRHACRREQPGSENTLEDEIRASIDLIESHRDSNIEWRALKRLYTQLCTMKQTPRVRRLREMIQPVLAKYGFHV